jgi:hypothetical protein
MAMGSLVMSTLHVASDKDADEAFRETLKQQTGNIFFP